jgi:hypothetical protein
MNALLLIVALTISGECGPVGQGCEMEMARTMANRVGTVGFPSTISGVLEAYYARAEKPSSEALQAATLLWLKPEILRDGRFFYAYSDDDRRTQGWPKGELVLRADGLAVNFSAEFGG